MNAEDTSSAAPWRRPAAPRARGARAWLCSWQRGSGFAAAADDIEEHFLQGAAAVAGEQDARFVIVLDAPLLHDDHPLAQPLDFGHVVRRQEHGGTPFGAV